MSRDGGGRLVFLDAARTAACALVVLVHANIGFRPGLDAWWPGGLGGAPMFSLAVPVFFAIAGFLAERGLAREAAGPWVRARILRLAPPYLAWNALLLATGLEPVDGSPGRAAFYFVFGANHLYFVCALLQLLAIHAWLGRRVPGRALAALAGVLTATYFAAADAFARSSGWAAVAFESDLSRLFVPWAAFYAAGAWLGRSPRALGRAGRAWAPLFAAAALSYAAYVVELRELFARFGFHPVQRFLLAGLPFQTAGALLALGGAARLEAGGRARRVLGRLAASAPETFGIYLAHVPVQAALFALALRLGYPGTDATDVPILAAASWLACSAGLALARRTLPPRAAAMLLGIATPTGT